MDYPYENLGPERFQLFCQSLLLLQFPNLQSFPVGQPDGGRDAVHYLRGQGEDGNVVFQVKFVRNPAAESDPHKWLEGILTDEAPKVAKLLRGSVKEYFLLTNVAGTAHLGTGSIDKVHSLLNAALEIPAQCWWRADLNTRLDSAWDLKWTYPELLTGPDFLRIVAQSGLTEHADRRAAAITAFLAHQHSSEQEVKFKQVELQNSLLDLFIDVPLSRPMRWQYSHWDIAHFRPHLVNFDEFTQHEEDIAFDYEPFPNRPPGIGAATFLLGEGGANARYVVLEGAPGQGKSTITQYICQVYRMRLLKKESDLARVSLPHKSGALRLPIKVDLRDFATWLERKNPFTAEAEEVPTAIWSRNIESFLAFLISHFSGGTTFDVSDLLALSRISAIIIVLDGLDEVADIKRREDVVTEIEAGANRLSANCASLRIVVTSRPAAFENSPGLSQKRFVYYSLDSVTTELIDEYAEKWVKARRLQEREGNDVKKILKEKLEQSHIKDLARNPMQLAILLSLIHTRGRSLPDKRTALYDSYIDLFFNRESEKSVIVRDNRELLIDIHRYLAWLLHTESEAAPDAIRGTSSGAISAKRLGIVLREYLETEGHNPALADDLFTGVVERVVALVSRVQGTYEFEVQPLREYFAARFLFETAPYSPPGNERRGTRPDRFDAISRNFYWLNVTRFFAGCYSKGELASLIDRMRELIADKDYRHLRACH